MTKKAVSNSMDQVLFNALLKIAKKRKIGVVYDYKPGNWSSPSMLVIIRDESGKFSGFFIAVNPELSLTEKVKSLAVNLGFYKLSHDLNHHFFNLVQPSDRLALWFEDYRGRRDLMVDRFAKRLLAFLTKKMVDNQETTELTSQVV